MQVWILVFAFWSAVFFAVAWLVNDFTWGWLDLLIRAGGLTFMTWLAAYRFRKSTNTGRD
jgi:hypothetical protein